MAWLNGMQVGDAGFKYNEPTEIPALLERMQEIYLELQVRCLFTSIDVQARFSREVELSIGDSGSNCCLMFGSHGRIFHIT